MKITAMPPSSVLSRLKDFLPQIAEANKQLESQSAASNLDAMLVPCPDEVEDDEEPEDEEESQDEEEMGTPDERIIQLEFAIGEIDDEVAGSPLICCAIKILVNYVMLLAELGEKDEEPSEKQSQCGVSGDLGGFEEENARGKKLPEGVRSMLTIAEKGAAAAIPYESRGAPSKKPLIQELP